MHFASGPRIVSLRNNRVVRDPPMPAQLIEAFADGLTQHADRQRWSGTLRARWVGWIAIQPCYAHLRVVHVVIAFQILVTDRPVFGHAIEGARTKVRRMESRKVGRPVMRAAAYRVEHQNTRRVCSCLRYRIVFPASAHIGAEVESSSM